MTLRLLLLFASLSFWLTATKPLVAASIMVATSPVVSTADEEYDRYKREGDELFKKGDYEKARKKFLACLEVPNFSNDTYAKGKVDLCLRANQLRLAGETALNSGKGTEAVDRLKQVLLLNSDDPITRKTLADYWEKEANQKYAAKNYGAAKTRYEEALKYAVNGQSIELLIQNCVEKMTPSKDKEEPKPTLTEAKPVDNKLLGIEKPKPIDEPKPIIEPTKEPEQVNVQPQTAKIEPVKSSSAPPATPSAVVRTRKVSPATKVLVGLIGVGAGGYAYLLNSQWQTKLKALNTASSQADPDGDGIILGQANYNQWKTANDEAKVAQSKHTLFLACLGAAAGSALLETHLLLRKPKPAKGLSFVPASHSTGVAIRFDF